MRSTNLGWTKGSSPWASLPAWGSPGCARSPRISAIRCANLSCNLSPASLHQTRSFALRSQRLPLSRNTLIRSPLFPPSPSQGSPFPALLRKPPVRAVPHNSSRNITSSSYSSSSSSSTFHASSQPAALRSPFVQHRNRYAFIPWKRVAVEQSVPISLVRCARYATSSPSATPIKPIQPAGQGETDASRGSSAPSVPDLASFPVSRIRNFCIISHIDHGKTTLSTRIMQLAGTLERKEDSTYLDKLQVEKERGITVRAHTTSLIYSVDGVSYLLNLIDTPGHVDFTYEVSRSLSACQGAVLLVDCTQGVQAQTIANFFLAFEADLRLIPVLNKIDLPTSDVKKSTRELVSLGFEESELLQTSGKTGKGVDALLRAVIERIPCPPGDPTKPLKTLLFDTWFDHYRGVISVVNVVDGTLRTGDKIVAAHTKKVYDAEIVGLLYPNPQPTGVLYTGQVGYLATGMRSTKEARVGDTFYHEGIPVEPLPGFKPAKPMVYAGIYPANGESLDRLTDAVEKLTLNDSSVAWTKERSDALGMGFRCGFLGLLHMDVFLQRLNQEYGAEVIATAPMVPYVVMLDDGAEVTVKNPSAFPPSSDREKCLEPMVEVRLVAPREYMSSILKLCLDRRGQQREISYIDERVHMRYLLPLSELITDFNDKLKSYTSGFATLDYEEAGYAEADLVKVTMMLNGEPVEALSTIVHRSKAQSTGRDLALKLKNVLHRQMYQVAIQAAVDGRVVARETLQAFRKDVTAKCYGGDVTRKRKLLDKQKEGKKRMKTIGSIELTQEAFYSVLKKDE